MIDRARAQTALDAAFEAHLTRLLDNFAVGLATERLDKVGPRFDSGFDALLKAHSYAQQRIDQSFQDDKSEADHYR